MAIPSWRERYNKIIPIPLQLYYTSLLVLTASSLYLQQGNIFQLVLQNISRLNDLEDSETLNLKETLKESLLFIFIFNPVL